MRRLSLAAAAVVAITVSTPALAQEETETPSAAMAQMADPATQQQVAMMAQAMGEILLDMPVAPLIEAASRVAGKDVAGDVDPDARVADLVGPDARGAPAAMAERIPAMMSAMAVLAGTLEQLAPQLRDIAARLPRTASTNE